MPVILVRGRGQENIASIWMSLLRWGEIDTMREKPLWSRRRKCDFGCDALGVKLPA